MLTDGLGELGCVCRGLAGSSAQSLVVEKKKDRRNSPTRMRLEAARGGLPGIKAALRMTTGQILPSKYGSS